MNTKTNNLPESVTGRVEEGKLCWCRFGGIDHLALLQGKITYFMPDQLFYICFIASRLTLVVKPETCRPVKTGGVREGLIDIMCHHPDYGVGVIIAEEFIEKALIITMKGAGKDTFRTPLNDVDLCCYKK